MDWRRKRHQARQEFEKKAGISFDELGFEPDPVELSSQDATTLKGTVSAILYRGEDGYTVFTLELDGSHRHVKVAGPMPQSILKGDHVWGTFVEEEHATYGKHYAPLSPRSVQVERAKSSPKTWVSEMAQALIAFAPTLTKSNAERIARKLREHDANAWKLLTEPTAPALAQIAGVAQRRQGAVSRELQKNRTRIQSFRILVEKERFPPLLALAAVQLWPERALKIAPRHPALLLLHPRASFEDLLAAFGELDQEDLAQAAVLEVLQREHRQGGHTYPPNERIVERGLKLIGKGAEKKLRDAIEHLVKHKILVRLAGDTQHAGLYNVAEKELAILRTVTMEHGSTPRPRTRQPLIPPPTWDLTDEQKQVFRLVNRHPLVVVTGGAGSGKSYLIGALSEAALQAGWTAVITATTGKAVANLRKALNDDRVQTIHAFIGYENLAHPLPPGKPLNRTPHLLVIDEAGMMDLDLAYEVLTRLPLTRIVLIGDANQLPPVGAGQPYRDLVDLAPTVRLTRNFRQAEATSILEAAERALRGEDPTTVRSNFVEWHFLDSPEEAVQLATELYLKYNRFDEAPLLISPTYRGRSGIHALNRSVKSALNPGEGKAWKLGDENVAHRGDLVVATENDWSIPVANGQVGRIGNGSSEGVFVAFGGMREVWVPSHRLEILRLGYALSVHRAQGSQAETAIFVVDPEHASWLSRELIYTALTRAQRRLIYIGPRQAILDGLQRRYGRRDTLIGAWRALSTSERSSPL